MIGLVLVCKTQLNIKVSKREKKDFTEEEAQIIHKLQENAHSHYQLQK